MDDPTLERRKNVENTGYQRRDGADIDSRVSDNEARP